MLIFLIWIFFGKIRNKKNRKKCQKYAKFFILLSSDKIYYVKLYVWKTNKLTLKLNIKYIVIFYAYQCKKTCNLYFILKVIQ